MRNITDEEQQMITGANGTPISLETVGTMVGGAVGARLAGERGMFAGGLAGGALGKWASDNAGRLGTIDPITINLPMNGTPSNHQYGGGFS